MNSKIEKLSQHGIMSVYERMQPDPGAKRFIVIREDTVRILEEFRMRKSAERFAQGNSKG
jgi:hypothetical protein